MIEVTWESWSLGNNSGNGKSQHWPILHEDAVVGEYVREGGIDTLTAGGQKWQISSEADHVLTAQLPDGRVLSATAKDRKKIARAKLLTVDLGESRPKASIVCEGATNYVVENAATDTKWGQFSGASRGVRHAEVQFDTDEGRALSDDEKIFMVWVARRVLESRMVSATWVLTISLVLLIVYLMWVWIV